MASLLKLNSCNSEWGKTCQTWKQENWGSSSCHMKHSQAEAAGGRAVLGRIRALCFCKRRNEKKVLNKQLFLPTGQRVVGWGNSGEFPLRNILEIEQEIPVEISVKIVEKVWQNAGFRTSDITTSLGVCSSHWQGLYVVIYWGLWKMVWSKWHSLLKQNCPCKCAAHVPCVPGRSREHELTFSVAETSRSHVLSAEPRRKWPHLWIADTAGVQKSLSHSSVETQSKIGGENFFSSEI